MKFEPSHRKDQQVAGTLPRSFGLLIGVLLAASLLLLVAFAASSGRPLAEVLSITVMVAAAAAAVGALLGFLFGIPRSLQGQPEGSTGDVARYKADALPYRANTNLEQISDWLTKILVGVGLIQLGSLPGPISRLITKIAADLNGNTARPATELLVGALLIFFAISGFLVSYLLTRLQLGGAFTRADQAAIREIAVAAAFEQVTIQQRSDAEALSVVARQLEPPPGTEVIPSDRLEATIRSASSSVRSQIFTLARGVRADNTGRNPEKMVRTVPIFRALIAANPDFHRNHGQLGYALKEQPTPNLNEAYDELNRAIELRNAKEERGWLYYELNRAVVRIKLLRGRDPTPETRQAILSDIVAANGSRVTREEVLYDPDIQSWLERWGRADDARES